LGGIKRPSKSFIRPLKNLIRAWKGLIKLSTGVIQPLKLYRAFEGPGKSLEGPHRACKNLYKVFKGPCKAL
jgi:hypothetical protein